MKCPVCPDSNLLMTERQNVEIDFCPNCRGVWLDRGELDKLIERSTAAASAQPGTPVIGAPSAYSRRDGHHTSHHGAYGQDQHRRKSWLGEIFD
jgi:Zn-finger nucleic acid-binding protein